MNDGTDTVRISLRLADGRFFPLFRYGDPEKREISLVPAREGQDEVDIHFFQHPADGGEPLSLGTLRFPDLPEEGEIELKLEARIDTSGELTVSVSHLEGDRQESLSMSLSDEAALEEGPSKVPTKRSPVFRWVFGVIFVLLCLALAGWATYAVAQWGVQDPASPPMSKVLSLETVDTV